jgi:4-hydroxybenzoate polyprenyltransferase
MRSARVAWSNDMWDRELDRKVTRTAGRPLASGALRMRQAARVPGRAAGDQLRHPAGN